MAKQLWTAILCSLAAAPLLLAQVNTATIVGTVTDPSGAAVPGAEVVAINTGTLAEKTTQTDATGSYVLERLPVGDYTLSITLEGFKQAERRDIQLDATQRVKIDVALEVGTVSESVTVEGGAPLVATQNTELGVVIAEQQVRNLPLNGRNFSQLIALEPGAVVSNGAVYFNGLTRDGVNITVDGTDATNPDRPGTANFGGQSQQNILSVEFIEEFKTTKGVFSAELGRAVSGGVNVITKSGTNELHGSVFEFLRNDVFDARNFFASRTDHLRLNQFGATVGGPIVRNRAFFFAGWERVRERRAQQVSGTVPTNLLREQMSAANPEYQRLLTLIPLSNEDRGDPYRGFHRRSAGRPTDEDAFIGRLDFNVSSKDSLFVRYTILDSFTLVPSLSPINGRAYPSQDRSATLSWNRIISPAAINEVRVGVSKQDIPRADQAFQHQQIGSLEGYLGTPGQEVLQANGGSYTLLDNFAYTAGRHSLKAGFEMRRFHYGRANFENPVYEMESREDLLASQFTNVRVTIGNDMRRLRETQWGFYVQDDFRFNSRLTLNLGLRYEYFTPVKERDGQLFNVVLDPFGPFRPQGEPIWESDRNNFGPRFGLAWDIGGDSKNVVRAGAGVFYSPNTYREVTALVNPPDTPYTLQLSAAEFPDLRYPIDALNLNPSEFEAPLLRTIFDPQQRSTYASQWSVDYQREIGRDLVATAGYVGNHGVKLLTLHWLNDLDPVTKVRPNPDVGRVSYQEHSGLSTYHAMQLSLRKRFSRGFMFNGHYTWGKAIERGGVDNMTASGTSTVQDHSNVRASRARTPQDIRHNFSLDYSWDVPFLSWFKADSGPARVLLGGWQVLGIVSMRTGTPILVTSGRDNFGLGSATGQRPDLVAGAPVTLEGYATSSTHDFLNRAAFVDPCDSRGLRRPCGFYGNFGAFAVSGPGSVNFDLSLFKNTQITERVGLQFRTEFFNIFNNTSFTNPNGTRTNGTFGQLTAAGPAREVQFALKLLF
jgi:hypothetical protein